MENRPRAKVIKQPELPKARVISGPEKMPGIIQVPKAFVTRVERMIKSSEPGLILPNDPKEFSRYCRERLGVGTHHGFTTSDMQKAAELLSLTPVAYYNPGNHWNLVLSSLPNDNGIRVYDPMSGIRDVRYGQVNSISYIKPVREDGSSDAYILFPYLFQKLVDDGYSVPEEPLRELGPIQTDPVNCGPLTLFAANYARVNAKK